MEDLLISLLQIILPLGLVLLGWFVGKSRESKHYKELRAREHALVHQPVTTTKTLPEGQPVAKSRFVNASVVIAVDAFKVWATGWRKIFGGELRSYAPLIDRARREAILRLREDAQDADLILNLRVETSKISGSAQKMGSVEAFAFGTAVYFHKDAPETDSLEQRSA